MSNNGGGTVTEASAGLLERGRQRAHIFDVPFAGLFYPPEAWALVRSGAAVMIDVRTDEEVKFVGRVPEVLHVVWKRMGEASPNPQFVQQVEAFAPKEAVVLLLCRSGVRSAAAAELLTQAGYVNAFNVLEGFEGEIDSNQHRGTFNGWRYHGLPWIQD